MTTEMSKVRWIAQNPPPGDDSPTPALLEHACHSLDLPFATIDFASTDASLPIPPLHASTVLHGRTSLLRAALARPDTRRAVFLDPARFTPAASLDAWGERMLNATVTVTTWDQWAKSPAAGRVFVRPNDDDKFFTGGVFARDELLALRSRLESSGRLRATDTIVVAPVRDIDAEARTFVVEGRVVGGSFYRPDDSPRLPADLVAFVEEAARTWSPAPVFVLDVARVDGAYRIVETNCMNGSRFYGADVRAIVAAISAFQARRWWLTNSA